MNDDIKVGTIFGKYKVLEILKRGGVVKAQCFCGVIKELPIQSLLVNRVGCIACSVKKNSPPLQTTHGLSRQKEYGVWVAMMHRCYDLKTRRYERYGGRGIIVCERWKNSVVAFYEDMGARPFKESSIERIDNNKGYCKENCRWATRAEQCRNRRSNIYVVLNGERVILKDACRIVGIRNTAVFYRKKRDNSSDQEAFTTTIKEIKGILL